MGRNLIVVVFLLAWSASAAFLTGSDLLETGRYWKLALDGKSFENESKIGEFGGYALGTIDALQLSGDVCVEAKVTRGQAGNILYSYLVEHPERLDEAAIYLATNAFKAAFPCTEDRVGQLGDR